MIDRREQYSSKKSVLNEINKGDTFTQGFKDWKGQHIKRTVHQSMDDLPNLLIKLPTC